MNDFYDVDGDSFGNDARYINHSCCPNSESVFDTCPDPSQDRIWNSATRDINAGEEITYDYCMFGDAQIRCRCGAPKCTGVMNADEE